MSALKHTPWNYDSACGCVRDSRSYTVTEMYAISNDSDGQMMASAPELLEALELLLLAYETTKEGASIRVGAEAKARLAIAKAGGAR